MRLTMTMTPLSARCARCEDAMTPGPMSAPWWAAYFIG